MKAPDPQSDVSTHRILSSELAKNAQTHILNVSGFLFCKIHFSKSQH